MAGDLFRSFLGELLGSALAGAQQTAGHGPGNTATPPLVVPLDAVPLPSSDAHTTAPSGDEERAFLAGSLDSTFGSDGIAGLAVSGAEARALAFHTDGSWVLAGASSNGRGHPSITIARFDRHGHPRRTFGGAGCVRLDLQLPTDARTDSSAAGVAIQPDGKIVLAGAAQQPPSAFSFQDLVVARLTPEGLLDTTFAGTGWRQIRLGMACAANTLCLEPDGRILVAGYVRGLEGGRFQILVMKLMPDGEPDRAFGSGGFVVLPGTSDVEEAFAIARDPRDGRIVGAARLEAGFDKRFAVFRLEPDGRMDAGFGTGGRRTLDLGPGDNVIRAIAVQPDGRCVVAGYLQSRQYVLVRLGESGNLDPGFAGGGILQGAFSGSSGSGASFGTALSIDQDGAIYLGGSVTERVSPGGYAAGMPIYDADRSCALARFLADGRPDKAFGAGGSVLVELGTGVSEVRAVAVDGDMVIAAGHSARGLALLRFHTRDATATQNRSDQSDSADSDAGAHAERAAVPEPRQSAGWLDKTFGAGGAFFANFGSSSAEGRALAMLPDGGAVIAGSVGEVLAPGGRDLGLVRVGPKGSPDPGFGVAGYKLLDIEGADNAANAVTVLPDGSIVVAGELFDSERGTSDFALVRLDATGRADPRFNGGVVVTDFFGGTDDRALAVAAQQDGKIVAAGHTTLPPEADAHGDSDEDGPSSVFGTELFALARYAADGTLDETFGAGGMVKTVMATGAGAFARVRAVQIQPDGSILAAGAASAGPDGAGRRIALARYQANGELDQSFGAFGRVLLDIDGTDEGAYALAVQPEDGRIVIAGWSAKDSESPQHFLVARLDRDGRLDTAFNGSGSAICPEFAGVARGVTVLPDGRIVAAGSAAVSSVQDGDVITREQVAILCYRADGSIDEGFGSRGALLIDLGGDVDTAHAVAMNEGRLLVAATSRIGEQSFPVVLRLNTVL